MIHGCFSCLESLSMLPRHNDPIAAIATAPGRGGVGIVRISGKGLGPLVQALLGRTLRPREATYLPFNDAAGQPIDRIERLAPARVGVDRPEPLHPRAELAVAPAQVGERGLGIESPCMARHRQAPPAIPEKRTPRHARRSLLHRVVVAAYFFSVQYTSNWPFSVKAPATPDFQASYGRSVTS